ncbi:Multidrug resistance-associated protein 1 [Linnemannia gamsii]|uniref:Multidrug resistance-associated protein 1 n=1 Tax=Linnemannia gamsii TaxID=64522 RepID=A0ABQ7K2A6_9FUNG|nr:Multidrug resistance-associated protein 1 [Linnemannia gamsii]
MANRIDTEGRPSGQGPIGIEFEEVKVDPYTENTPPPPLPPTATTRVKRISKSKRKPYILGDRFFLLDWCYLWVFGLIHRCREQTSIKKILLELANVLTAKKNGEDLDAKWSQEKASAAAASRSPKLIRALYELYGTKYILIGVWKLIWAACTWAGAYYFLRVSIEFLEQAMPARTGYLYAMGLLLTSLGSSIAIHQLYGQCTALGIQVKASICVLIYRKALVLARIRGGAGEIINIVSTDVARIVEAVTNFHFLWSAMVETILILALAFPTVGWAAALTAVILVLVVLPVQVYLGRLTSNIQIEQTAVTTERVHLMSEILTAIKLIKFYAWEAPFQEQVSQVRARELALFKKNLQVKAINMAVVFALPVIVSVSSLAVYNSKRTGPIDSSVVFTALSIYNTLRYPFLMLPIAVKSTSGARLALRRLDDFLTQPEVEPLKEYSVSEGGNTAIELIDGEFTWDGDDNGPALQGINLKVKRGEVVAIVGDVGSGKSSFVAALLGQIRQTGSGPKLKLYGKSSYVPQEAWLNNLTLRENIVFGKAFEEERYNTTVKVCALERDLTLLAHGDRTEIAERGSNLSGGQKQRVSLARAVYHKSDIVLMDDPLSAVDQNVGKHIFDQCIRGYLAGRTVIIVTHQLQYLHRCDRIVMLQSGKIAYQGTYQELMANEPTFNTLINTHVSSEDADGNDDRLGNDAGVGDNEGEDGEREPTLEEQLMANENNNQVTASGSNVLAEITRKKLGAGPRRHTLPPGTKVGDAPGTTTIVNQNYATITPQERLRLLQRHLPYINKNSILASTLEDHVNINFINRAGGGAGYYSPMSDDFSRAIYRNELTIHSIPEGGIYGNQAAKDRKRKQKQQHRKSISGASLRRHATRASEKDSFDYTNGGGNSFHHHQHTALPEGDIEIEEDSDSDSDDDEENPAALVGEDKSMDELGFADYVKYFRAGSGVLVTLLMIALFFIAHGIRIGSDYWLRLWVPNTLNTTDQVYLGVYGAFIAAFAAAVLLRGLWFAHEATLKAKELHDRAFKSVMLAPMSFFETTSLGRILSAFSKCMFTVDDTLPDAALLFLQYFPLALGAFLLIACVVHWQNAVTVIVLLLIALLVIWYGSPADSKLKQLEALSKPPVFQHITTTLEGLFSIRAYNVQTRFDGMNMDVLDKNHESLYAMMTTKTWTAFYLDIISSFMVFSTALFLVIYRDTIHQAPSVAGLALSNALQMLVFLQWTVRQMGEVQAQISTVGQLDFYGCKIDPEAPAENPATKPDASWPQEGRIDFNHLVLSYRKNTPPVLKDVSFTINPREKIGIVGRTGSGKSTLLVGLLRIVEASGGGILIDGVDISKIGLKDLRTKVGIIPQEPVLFVGTIRTNLDPFGQFEDNSIWRALDAVHLGDKVKEMPLKLDSPVIEHGKNFSLGQRQLICIARSLVIGSKIIVLDEATASIDMVTDRLLQETIKESFADCTVLTIAHRLNTIIESDKVLVMDGGVVAEFGEPHKLLQDPNGIFAELVSHAGEAAAKKLAMIAEDAHKDRNNGLDLVIEEAESEEAAAGTTVEPYTVIPSIPAAANVPASAAQVPPSLQVPGGSPIDQSSAKAETEGLAKAKAHLRQLSSTSASDTGVIFEPSSPNIAAAATQGSSSPTSPTKGEAAVEKQFQRLFRDPATGGDTPAGSPELKPQTTTTTPFTEPADDINLSR